MTIVHRERGGSKSPRRGSDDLGSTREVAKNRNWRAVKEKREGKEGGRSKNQMKEFVTFKLIVQFRLLGFDVDSFFESEAVGVLISGDHFGVEVGSAFDAMLKD